MSGKSPTFQTIVHNFTARLSLAALLWQTLTAKHSFSAHLTAQPFNLKSGVNKKEKGVL